MAEMTENLIRLKTVHGIGNAILWRLLRQFGDSDGVYAAGERELCSVKGVTREKAGAILDSAKVDPRPEMEKAVRAGVDIIPYDDASYPKPLLHSFDPPVVLYVQGRLSERDNVAVGVVGTRQASGYGRNQALDLSSALSHGGYTIVSGLARGIDTFAHIGALNAGGRTVGVLGCGFDHMYPEENRDLALEMSRKGAVISEFSMATPPSRETFPARNRIIAGMCLGLLVIEAPVRSGALITARLANEIGRTVFAVPGRMNDPNSEGCNKLIQDGAVMVTSVDDIFHELNPALPLPEFPRRETAKKRTAEKREASGALFAASAARNGDAAAPARKPPATRKAEEDFRAAPKPELTVDQTTVLATVSEDWRTADEVVEMCGLPAGKVTGILAMLKLKRVVEQGPGQTYRLYKH